MAKKQKQQIELSEAAQLSAELMREKYPEIAKLTVREVVDMEVFRKAAQEKIDSLYRIFTKARNDDAKYVYAATFFRLYRSKEFSQLAFGPNYLDVLDRQSSLSSTERRIIKSIGDEVYAKVIAQMIKDYDEQHAEK